VVIIVTIVIAIIAKPTTNRNKFP